MTLALALALASWALDETPVGPPPIVSITGAPGFAGTPAGALSGWPFQGLPGSPWSFATERGGYRARLSAGYGTTHSAGLSRESRGHRYASSQPDAGGGSYYVVRPGDTPSGIAAQFGTSVRDLASANGIPDPDFIPSDRNSTTDLSRAVRVSCRLGA